MTEQEIYNRLKEIEKLINPEEINIISAYISGFLQDFEEELNELNYLVSNLWLRIKENEALTDTKATHMLQVTPEYRRKKIVELRIIQLKRMKSDLRSRFNILTFQKFH